jgi:hypothetical protein
MALIPVGLAIMPINKLTLLLLLVLAADVAVALLLADDLRRYRLHTAPISHSHQDHAADLRLTLNERTIT